MKHVSRLLEGQVLEGARSFPAVVLTGPRRAGKTWMLRHLFPEASYCLAEDPDVVGRLRADPQGFLDGLKTPAIIDEVQNIPEVFAHLRARIDEHPELKGQWFLTGSQEAPLMEGVTESMAGRAAILHLLPFSAVESEKVSMLLGGYPEVLARPAAARLWFSSYVQTYLERDVRAVTAVRDLATFRRFISLLAARHGQVLNRSDLATPLGVSVPTVSQWLGVMEITAQVLVVPPYYENLGKRLIKAPKLYIADPGLACHLLGIETGEELERSPFRGAVFEGLVASEIIKWQVNRGLRPELYHFRDQQGLQVDFVVPGRGGGLRLVECKAGKTVTTSDAIPLQQLAKAVSQGGQVSLVPEMFVVHQPTSSVSPTRTVAPGVVAVSWRDFAAWL